ncbi:MAG: 3'(2'),5'-bisphosphate nucleotidase CysQ, partial [Wenzhouxiangella sp.]
MDLAKLIVEVRKAVVDAAAEILQIYADPKRFETENKSDDSPLTAADVAANKLIVARLQELTPHIPILSEESKQAPWSERRHWDECWVVDPLDGTREFLKRNDEFTVNVALVRDHKPILGVVYAPALQHWYWAAEGEGAWYQKGQQVPVTIQVSDKPADRPWKVVGSRSHNTPEVDAFVERLGEAEMVAMGSSLKLCLVADGSADVYPRLGPTCEWDTCAAQAVVEQAGGQVVDADTGKPLTYNARETLLNPFFIA